MSVSLQPPYISLSDISIRIYERSLATTLKQRILRREPTPPRSTSILHGVSLRVVAGERLGILGRNGSGKTTLLRAIAGIYPIAGGTRDVLGRLAPVIGQGIGFDPELSLYENIRLGLIYAGRYSEWTPKLQAQILDFAELTERANEPLKLLSSGYQARLAFALSLFQNPDILLLDETLAAGDFAFFDKALTAMLAHMNRTPISVFVSHSEDQIRRVCTRCIVMSRGRLVVDAAPEQAILEYRRIATETAPSEFGKLP